MRGIVRSLEMLGPPGAVRIGVIDYRRRLMSEVPDELRLGFASTPDEAHALVARVVSEISTRSITDETLTAGRPEIVLVVTVNVPASTHIPS